METKTVTDKGQVRIPKEMCQRLGMRKGTQVVFSLQGWRVGMHLTTPPAPAPISGFGMLKSAPPAVPADFDPAALLGDAGNTWGSGSIPTPWRAATLRHPSGHGA
jgi:AbrB family looped-hinge helix DNA binding protein